MFFLYPFLSFSQFFFYYESKILFLHSFLFLALYILLILVLSLCGRVGILFTVFNIINFVNLDLIHPPIYLFSIHHLSFPSFSTDLFSCPIPINPAIEIPLFPFPLLTYSPSLSLSLSLSHTHTLFPSCYQLCNDFFSSLFIIPLAGSLSDQANASNTVSFQLVISPGSRLPAVCHRQAVQLM